MPSMTLDDDTREEAELRQHLACLFLNPTFWRCYLRIILVFSSSLRMPSASSISSSFQLTIDRILPSPTRHKHDPCLWAGLINRSTFHSVDAFHGGYGTETPSVSRFSVVKFIKHRDPVPDLLKLSRRTRHTLCI